MCEAHLADVRAHGFEAVELFAVRGHFNYQDAAAAEALATWLRSTGVRLHSVHCPIVESLVGGRWGAAYNNATTDGAARDAAVREAIAAIELAAVLPYDYLVVHLGLPSSQRPGPGDNDREQAKRSVEQIHAVAERRGVRLALEVIPNTLSTPESLVTMIEEELELPHVGICLDFGHAFLMGDLVDALETVAGHMITTHVHDNRGKTDDHLVPFEGRIDWPSALMAVQKIGYDGTLLLELQSTEPAGHALQKTVEMRRRFEEAMCGEWGQMIADQQ
ncbi:MAG: sugar phosphate isomerase/epimerase family protein [Bacteroidales bacterium]